jgi:hypothetical protein
VDLLYSEAKEVSINDNKLYVKKEDGISSKSSTSFLIDLIPFQRNNALY